MLKALLGVMAATIAINTIFVVSVLASLDDDQRALFVLAPVVLAGGLFFSIRTMQRLNRPIEIETRELHPSEPRPKEAVLGYALHSAHAQILRR